MVTDYIVPDTDLAECDRDYAIQEAMKLRRAVRYARDQMFDEKCWLDFFRLFELLPEGEMADSRMLSPEQMEKNCKDFIKCMHCYFNNRNKTIDQIYEIWTTEKPY